MKTTLAVAISAVTLAACAGTNGALDPSPKSVAAAKGHTYYCWQERLDATGDSLVCNWEGSALEACTSTGVMSIARSTVANEPQKVRRCENGQWLVMVTTK